MDNCTRRDAIAITATTAAGVSVTQAAQAQSPSPTVSGITPDVAGAARTERSLSARLLGLAIVRARDGAFETAFEFSRVGFGRHVPSSGLQLLLRRPTRVPSRHAEHNLCRSYSPLHSAPRYNEASR